MKKKIYFHWKEKPHICGEPSKENGTYKEDECEILTIREFYAKTDPRQSIFTHSVVSGRIAQLLWDMFLCEGTRRQIQECLGMSHDALKNFLGYLVSLHDTGKLSCSFSKQIPDADYMQTLTKHGLWDEFITKIMKPIRHEWITGRMLERIWGDKKEGITSGDFFASILQAHHQRNKDSVSGPILKEEAWYRYQQELEKEMRNIFLSGKIPDIAVQKSHKGIVSVIFLGITILADWIASGELFQDAEEWISEQGAEEKLQKIAKRFLEESGLCLVPTDFGSSFSEMWPEISTMRPLQSEIEKVFLKDERISLILIEAPMGEGKTEAGIYAAMKMKQQWCKGGIYFGLPTSATSNQMVQRVRALFKQHKHEESVRLLHAMAWLVDDFTPEYNFQVSEDEIARSWLEPLRRGLLSQYAVGTIDQAMMAAMMIQYGVLRLIGLSNKVLIADEIHAFDVYMNEIIDCLLHWCRALQIPVVLLSATLPPEKKQKLVGAFSKEEFDASDYPAITTVSEAGHVSVYPIQETVKQQVIKMQCLPYLYQTEKIANTAVDIVKDGGCLCVLMNTVKSAQEVFQEIRKRTDVPTLLFHAQFPAEKRDFIEKKCITLFGKDKSNRPKQFILVATQVVEQSLDVDFDSMITAIAPMDLVLQRAGRVFRHQDTIRPAALQAPTLFVLIPKDEEFQADGVVYAPCFLKQTISLLKQHSQIRIPEDMQKLVADTYDDEKVSKELFEDWIETKINEQFKKAQASKYILGKPERGFPPVRCTPIFNDLEGYGFLSAKTRLSEPAVRIALVAPDIFYQARERSSKIEEREHVFVSDKKLARLVLKRSVSVQQKRIHPYLQDKEVLVGKWLLQGVFIFKSKDGHYESSHGKRIIFDDLLGLCMEE